MAQVIKNNKSAQNTLNTLNRNSKSLAKSLAKVSSGMKITSAGDDASGYAISERMRVQIRGLDQATANTQNATSLVKVASGALDSTVDILRTMKEKAINAANDTNTDADRATIQKEWDQMIDQIDDNANITYNGKYLLDGSHDDVHEATGAIFANDYLENDPTGIPATGVPMVELKDRNGQSLGIQDSDRITFSVVQQGRTYTHTFEVAGRNFAELYAGGIRGQSNYFLKYAEDEGFQGGAAFRYGMQYYGKDGYGEGVAPADGRRTTIISTEGDLLDANGKLLDPFYSDFTGPDYQIAGITMSVTDRYGKVKTSVNAVLNHFELAIRARNVSDDNAFVFQVGTKANQAIKLGITDMRSYALGLKGKDGHTVSLSTQANANAAIAVVDTALKMALDQQTTLGSVASRLEYTADNLRTGSENTQASESTVRDADMAKEMTEYTKTNVLTQAAQSMLA